MYPLPPPNPRAFSFCRFSPSKYLLKLTSYIKSNRLNQINKLINHSLYVSSTSLYFQNQNRLYLYHIHTCMHTSSLLHIYTHTHTHIYINDDVNFSSIFLSIFLQYCKLQIMKKQKKPRLTTITQR